MHVYKACTLQGSTGADPGFPVGGRGHPTWVLFGENVCENERIGSRWGGGRAPENFVCRSTNVQALLLSHLIGQAGTCTDQTCPS